MVDEEIFEIIEGAEKDEEGLTNEVYFTDNKVIKIYSKYPLTSFLVSLTTLLTRPKYYSRGDRMKSENQATKIIEQADSVGVPKVLESDQDTMIFEKITGSSGHDYLNKCTGDEAYELGVSLRNFFQQIHSENFALRDARISNFIIQNQKIYSIDHEYADLNSNKVTNFIDELTLISSIRQTNNYQSFKKGYNPGRTALSLSFFTSIAHALLLERSLPRTKKAIKSLKGDF